MRRVRPGPLVVMIALLALPWPTTGALFTPAPGAGVSPATGPALDALVPVPQPGAFVVLGHHVVRDDVLTLAGDLVVPAGATLVLRNATLAFHATPDRHPTLRVLPGGAVLATDCRVTNTATGSPEARAFAWFTVEVQGRFEAERCVLEYARDVTFSGPASTGNRIEESTLQYFAGGFVTFIRDASGALERNRVHGNFGHPVGGARAGAVLVADTTHVTVRDNLFEDVRGESVVAVQATGVGSFVHRTAARVTGNLFLDSAPTRDPAGMGARMVFVGGGLPDVVVADNAMAASFVGVATAYGASALVTGNDVLAVRVPGLAVDRALVGLRASGATALGANGGDPVFELNRVRGFESAAQVVNGGDPLFRANALGPSNALGMVADAGRWPPVDARANWWGPAPGTSRVTGDVDVTDALAADPTAARALDVAVRVNATAPALVLTLSNRADVPFAVTVHVRNAPGAPASLDLTLPPGTRALTLPLTGLPGPGTDTIVLAWAAGGLTAVGAARTG